MEYDTDGQLIRQAYYSVSGQPAADNNYISIQIKEYEDDGRLVRTHYYSPSGSVTACKSGYSVLEQYYDEAGTLTGEAYFDTSGNRVTLKGGWCGYNIEVQSDGTKVKHYYNTAGTIVKSQ